MDQIVNTIEELDYDGLKPEVVDEMLRQAEMRQMAIFSASLGMDQRAAVIGAGLVAVAGALAAGGLAASSYSVRLPSLAIACFIGVGAALCVWACRPQKSRFPGIDPMEWAYDPAYLHEPLIGLKMERLAKIQDAISENQAKQHANGIFLSIGLLTAALGPLIFAISWALSK